MLNYLKLTLLFFLSLLFLGCSEPVAKVDNPKTYQNEQITFQYPSNWKLTEEITEENFQNITVESSGSAISMIHYYPNGLLTNITEYAKGFAQMTREEISHGSFSKSKFGKVVIKQDPEHALNERLFETVDITFFKQKIPDTRIYQHKSNGNHDGFIIAQVANEDSKKVIKGFDLIFSTFKIKQTNNTD